ncbi:DUF4160 domain-containing protein [Fulvimarina sp. 2208YS6-2-32]|uniref:DUF4160 domain-containing protein n=1 Tax=Fulvimarina uroteuthidis TaxID=3098149 RepID=A0ABU5HY60_9HYPH|nr:DUF4160 domain-containing protein [Fulvimarina sp. 2208YS6-2-32]MDY8108075.1 DUF4160 domain-containing protein [Fulvimarina sp. 2208YS6-2-32]
MPTIFKWKGWTFLFYSLDRSEPPHVHARKDKKELKLWLLPVRLAYNRRCADHEVNAVVAFAEKNERELLDAWNRHFG